DTPGRTERALLYAGGVSTRDMKVCPGSDAYPVQLRNVPNAPALYVRGTVRREDALSVAIVGSRHATPYGLSVAEPPARDVAARARGARGRGGGSERSAHHRRSGG